MSKNLDSGQTGQQIALDDFEVFNRVFLEWLDRNQESLEGAGTGDVLDLMNRLASSGQEKEKYLNLFSHESRRKNPVGRFGPSCR